MQRITEQIKVNHKQMKLDSDLASIPKGNKFSTVSKDNASSVKKGKKTKCINQQNSMT